MVAMQQCNINQRRYFSIYKPEILSERKEVFFLPSLKTVGLIGSSIANKNKFVFLFLPMSTDTYDWREGVMMHFKTVTRLLHSKEIEDLEFSMVLEGCVTNVAIFGAFVDIGAHRKQYLMVCYGKGYKYLAGSETSCMHRNFLHGNRETLNLT
jgi:hypothetical protein